MTIPELIKWLRENSSGDYRPAATAADIIEILISAIEEMGADAYKIQNLSYGPHGDCGAVKIAERIELICDGFIIKNT